MRVPHSASFVKFLDTSSALTGFFGSFARAQRDVGL
jgi:hypothetical protein